MKLRVQGQEEDQRGPGERFFQEDCQARKLNKEDAMDRKWRMMIKDSDDQDGCEWVNVSSGTGLPV